MSADEKERIIDLTRSKKTSWSSPGKTMFSEQNIGRHFILVLDSRTELEILVILINGRWFVYDKYSQATIHFLPLTWKKIQTLNEIKSELKAQNPYFAVSKWSKRLGATLLAFFIFLNDYNINTENKFPDTINVKNIRLNAINIQQEHPSKKRKLSEKM